ncbi:MAG: TatD family deoxyribonuclease [Ruminococcaceae bacterium]|nr:TatD family deoxyribonuclease [Oscillospiraceae bacterium]
MNERAERSLTGLFDSHAHYFDRRFEAEAEEGADGILCREVFGKGMAGVINVATNPENARACIGQAARYERMYAAIGIHPEDCLHLDSSAEEELEKLLPWLEESQIRKEKKIVAIGEIGLDYYWQPCDKERQAAFFEAQLSLAQQLDMPVIIHDRDAHGDCFETVLRYPRVMGVFHSFSGSAEMAKELCRRGWYLSFSGVLTFRNARRVREVAEIVPAEQMLLETDCPYLTPEPYRGRLNHSGYLCHTAELLASVRGMTYEEIVAQTSANTKRLFKIM